MTPRLFAAAERVDAYFSGRLGAIVPDETRQAILAELSAAVAEARHVADLALLHAADCGAVSPQ